mgnify:CR=1 FL=1
MTATWAWLVLLFPLLGSLTIGLNFKVLPAKAAGLIGISAIVAAFVCGILAVIGLQGEPSESRHIASSLWEYAAIGDFKINLGIYIDPLSLFMVLVVTGVSSLIHIYSIGYMEHDARRRRFFAYLNLFVAAMLLLVLADNYLGLYVGWEGVGLASYLLIGFWSHKPSAATAAKKAFVVNRVGDIGLALALAAMFAHTGTLSYTGVFAQAPHLAAATTTLIGLLLRLAACGKPAQVPLQPWLAAT